KALFIITRDQLAIIRPQSQHRGLILQERLGCVQSDNRGRCEAALWSRAMRRASRLWFASMLLHSFLAGFRTQPAANQTPAGRVRFPTNQIKIFRLGRPFGYFIAAWHRGWRCGWPRRSSFARQYRNAQMAKAAKA